MALPRRTSLSSRLDPSPAELSRSLTSLSLQATTSPPRNDSRRLSPHSASRRQSMEVCSATSMSSQRPLSRSPSTPSIRKRTSLSALNGKEDRLASPSSSLRRKSSLSSIRVAADPPATEASIAQIPQPPPQDMYAEATAILHDTSYGHRYSRPRTSAAELANIVERPERIPAAVVGISAAQVRSGRDRLAIRKTTRQGKLSDAEVMLVHAHTPVERGRQTWPEELGAMCRAAPEKLKKGELEVPKPYHAGDLYLSPDSLEDIQGCIGAVYEGVDLVYGDDAVRRAFVCIRPPGHHCAERQPSGFCFLNNVHIAIAHAAKEHALTHAVILDFDLHHGDGSQAIAWSINDLGAQKNPSKKKTSGINVPKIAYLSMHDINSFPCENGVVDTIRNASVSLESHNQFIHNVHMKPFSTLDEFWDLYEDHYKQLITNAERFLRQGQIEHQNFKAGVFISAGFDASEHEGSGMRRHNVSVPTDFFAKFTADAVELANNMCDGRVVSVLEGGYSDRAITSGVFSHMSALACSPPNRAEYIAPTFSSAYNGNMTPTTISWDEAWWSVANLEDLERLTAKKPPKAEKRATSFMSATAASSAKVETPRRISSLSYGNTSPPSPITPWEVRAAELSRCFIPQYQESVPIPGLPKASSTVKRDPSSRHSVGTTTERMTLRERKPKLPATIVAETGRRKTTGPALESAPVSRASSRASSTVPPRTSRAPSRISQAARSPTLKAPAVPPVSSTRGPRQTEPSMDALTSGMQKVRLTYKNERADREELAREAEVQRIQKEADELERQIFEAKKAQEAKARLGANQQRNVHALRADQRPQDSGEVTRHKPNSEGKTFHREGDLAGNHEKPARMERKGSKSSLPVMQRFVENSPLAEQMLKPTRTSPRRKVGSAPQGPEGPGKLTDQTWNGGAIKFNDVPHK